MTSGIYYYPPRAGEGITVQEWDGGCVVYFYTCGGWYSCEGVWNGAFYDLVVYKTTGPFMSAALKTEPCGKGQLVKKTTETEPEGTVWVFNASLGDSVRFSFQADGRNETYVMERLF